MFAEIEQNHEMWIDSNNNHCDRTIGELFLEMHGRFYIIHEVYILFMIC